ncbi:hypothetical protein BDZ45DRAFT_723060 [Acephala macrosclerotiorum]|nr:hypothetical protein BDZ45DRAFT_723060 [Acephala macrosclerotiorum]
MSTIVCMKQNSRNEIMESKKETSECDSLESTSTDSAVPQISKPSNKTSTSRLLKLPLEIRYNIFQQLLTTPHTIIIYPGSKKHSIFNPLLLTSHQLRSEIQKWILTHSNSNTITSTIFGIFNLGVTTFKLSYEFKPNSTHDDQRMQRRLPPHHISHHELKGLEVWQVAMTISNSDHIDRVNEEIMNNNNIESKLFLSRKKAICRSLGPPMEIYWDKDIVYDKLVLDTSGENEFLGHKKSGSRCAMAGIYVWSHGFENHAEHQEYCDPHAGGFVYE